MAVAEFGILRGYICKNEGNIFNLKECETGNKNRKLGKRPGIERTVMSLEGTLEALYFGKT